MSHIVIDRRPNGKNKSSVNRQRFLDRAKDRVKKAVQDAIRKGSIKDITSGKEERVSIPARDIQEHSFSHGPGGTTRKTFPGNKQFDAGDKLPKPKGGQGQKGNQGSPDGEGEDDFTISISREEFLRYFFDDLELPDMIRKELAVSEDTRRKRSGFVSEGNPSRMHLVKTMGQSMARRIALRNPKKKKIKELEKQLAELVKFVSGKPEDEATIERDKIVVIEKQITVLKKKLKAVPFIDDMDLKFVNYVTEKVPTTQAVMVCIMDVSGSMGEWEKEMAKRFFMLLYLFLEKNYERVDLVFIRHHTQATEVTEEEFFNSRETGGTVVSTALVLARKILEERYPNSKYNRFVTQISDGDNYSEDNMKVVEHMNALLKETQYYAYVEVKRGDNSPSDLWDYYEKIKLGNPNLVVVRVKDVTDIYPAFRSLFEKTKSKSSSK